jgi:hypothetical protein
MSQPITISNQKPSSPAQDFELLRSEALAYIQRISGQVWTDYNTHDPGVTILEVLCYAITDLSFRANKPIQDLLADEKGSLLGQFFKASEILPSKALTLQDYRKLLIDVEVIGEEGELAPFAGIKNAWIELRASNEIPIYPDRKIKKLAYKPFPAKEKALELGILYDVLLEFDTTEDLGDLNENKLSMEISIDEHISLSGVVVDIQVEFPRWDEKIDWTNKSEIRKAIQSINIQFQNLPDGFEMSFSLSPSNYIQIDGTELTPSGLEVIEDLAAINTQVNDYVFKDEQGVLSFYLKKIEKIREILDKAKTTLMANRNLCEDFVEFHALRVEEILVCADIELSQEAEVELTEARIFSAIGDFLSPQVNFYRLEEMLDRCKSGKQTISRIQQNPAKIWIELEEDLYPKTGSSLSIVGSGNNVGTYQILEVKTAAKEPKLVEITLTPNFSSPLVREDDRVFLGDWEGEQCMPTEKIFEGPLLQHGFIDSEELAQADRKSSIHVSDLIHLIMNIEGVEAVKSIQIANLPQDDPEGKIPSKSVRWCLKLAMEQNYVPRLNSELSKLMYYKEELPFKADREMVEDLLDEIQQGKRSQKIRYPQLDFNQIVGEFTDSGNYYSIQNDFPLVYGIGEDGMLPKSEGRPEVHQVKQLKAYLMVYEQFLANYLAQLSHVKDLFSFNSSKDAFGNSLISNTYFSQSLEELVPDCQDLWKDLAGLKSLVAEITESKESYLERRNRFLNHLLGRFAEQLTDYSLLTFRLKGLDGKAQLIEDKQEFLKKYPALSSERGLGYDYSLPESFFHPENLSGLENRLAGLYGIRGKKADWLIFRPHFVFTEASTTWSISIKNDSDQIIFEIHEAFESRDSAALALEKILMIGSEISHWAISGSPGNILVELNFEEKILGESIKKDFADEPSAQLLLEELQGIFLTEFLDNPRSNRKNLSLGLEHWYTYIISTSMAPEPPKYEVSFEFFDAPFGTGNLILQGKIEEEVPDAVNTLELENLANEAIKTHIWTMIAAGSRELGFQFPQDSESPYKLQLNDPIRGGLLAKSVESNFNSPLAVQLLDGTWGDAWLIQEGFSPLALSLDSAVAFGSKIRIKANVNPAKGDQIHFEKTLNVLSVEPEIHKVVLEGNHKTLLSSLTSLTFSVPLTSRDVMVHYPIFSLSVVAGNTEVILQTRPRADLDQGEVLISRTFEVVKIQGDEFLIPGGEEIKFKEKIQQFLQRQFFSHEGTHLFEHILLRPKIKGKYKFLDATDTLVTENLEDSLLDPHFQEECQCTLDNPYTCMAHVILPFWAGRFTNRDFRKFLEHKIKIEAPAHVFLTICWISPEHMQELERAWKIWQLESLKPEIHPKKLSTALSQLIGVLEKVRNVYPSGSLHDCAESDSLADAIILNFSSLGEF